MGGSLAHPHASVRDAKTALELVEEICDWVSMEQLLTNAVGRLCRFLNAETACGFELSHSGSRYWLGRAVTVHMRRSVLLAYNEQYLALDPICAPLFTDGGTCLLPTPTAAVIHLANRFNPANRTHQEYHTDFLHPERLDYVLALAIRPSLAELPLVVFGFQREGAGSDFTLDDIRRLRMIGSSIRSRVEALTMRAMLDEAENANQNLAESYDLSAWVDGCVSLTKSVAPGGVSSSQQPLDKVFIPGFVSVIDSMCGRTIATRQARGIVSALGIRPAPSTSEMRVERLLDKDDIRRFRLSFRKSDAPRWRIWASHHGLTPSEASILQQLALGLSNKEAANRLDLSIRTVENHVRAILQKSGHHSRSKLLSEMLS